MKLAFSRRATRLPSVAACATCVSLAVQAQTAPADAAAPAAATRLPEVVVTGNPLGASDLVAPVTTLSGPALLLRRGSTLGDTLDRLPGVSSSWFGPNANRPVIRGLDGDRVRVLNNSGAALDASSLSFDHAVPIDPLVVERVEVLRGPAALLYGGSATGGVVNTIDNRIPRAPVTGVSGSAEGRVGGAERERAGSALVEAGNGQLALHVDAFHRDTEDLRVPRFTPRAGGETRSPTRRVANSASQAKGAALGGAYTWEDGHLGASVDRYENDYGVVVEPDVRIRMRRDRYALAGEWRGLEGPLRSVKAQFSHTDYGHDEMEGAELGTRFSTRGNDGRIELAHAPLGPLHGVVGLQFEQSRFSALGEEAFVPGTRSRQRAVFVVEELPLARGKLSAGLRLERASVASDGDAAEAEEPRFGGPAERSFSLRSGSLGGLLDVAAGWQLSSSLSYTERAPTFYELFAEGVHVATAAYERGDAAQRKERGSHLDVALAWKQGPHSAKIGAWGSRFANFIALQATGETFGEPGEDGEATEFPVYAFQGVKARLWGVEAEGRRRLLDAGQTLDLEGRFDWVRASNADTGEPLPRIAPARLTVGLAYARAGWTARAEVAHSARQSRVSDDDIATDSHTLLNLSASYRFKAGPSDGTVFVRLDNATDELAYNAASIRTVRELAPLPGRGLKLGLRLNF
ncbi:TonB-dependent receptor [Aquabacterium sp. A7-Y]|uniref:TonB-dependent receptor n=1 Tax=Aquabacterium sp. A7-Y TaxID=1349605 RepID=UPI00223D75E2|nr:TonB-dependent receptor [Aquabacterium sp. A7-Y]MCW7539188.1 TonB-dependent receptor [Aquabacterium sp. A7-Y]